MQHLLHKVIALQAAFQHDDLSRTLLPHRAKESPLHTRKKIKRIVPTGWLKLAIAPHQGIRETLKPGIALSRIAHFGHTGVAHRTEARTDHASLFQLDHDMNVAAILLNDVERVLRTILGSLP